MKKTIFVVLTLIVFFVVIPACAAKLEGDYNKIHWQFKNGILSFTGSGTITDEGPWEALESKVRGLEFSGTNLHINFLSGKYKKLQTIHFGKGSKYVSGFSELSSKKIKLIIDEDKIKLEDVGINRGCITDIVLGEEIDSMVIEGNILYDKSKSKVILCFGSQKSNVIIPDSVKTICRNAFKASYVTGIHLPQGLMEIKDGAFADCKNLTSITIPESISLMGQNLFIGCEKLKAINFVNTDMTNMSLKSEDYYSSLSSLGELVIPNYGDITKIHSADNKLLKYIIVSEGNTEVSLYNLNSETKSNLIGIYIPDSIKKISGYGNNKTSGVVLYVTEGSFGQDYGRRNGIVCKIITPIKSIELSEKEIELKLKGRKSLQAKIIPENATAKKLSWFSSNDLVAVVAEGKVTAIGEGECDIYCRGLDCGLVTTKCHVVVTK